MTSKTYDQLNLTKCDVTFALLQCFRLMVDCTHKHCHHHHHLFFPLWLKKNNATHQKLSNHVFIEYCRGFSFRSILYFIQLMLMCCFGCLRITILFCEEILHTNNVGYIECGMLSKRLNAHYFIPYIYQGRDLGRVIGH